MGLHWCSSNILNEDNRDQDQAIYCSLSGTYINHVNTYKIKAFHKLIFPFKADDVRMIPDEEA